MPVIGLLTVLIALYGAILSTYIFVSQKKANKRTIKVKLSTGFISMGSSLGETRLIIEIINPGNRTVTICSTGLNLPGSKTVPSLGDNTHIKMPHELTEGKNCHFWFGMKNLASGLKDAGLSGKVMVVGYATDGADNTYTSKPYPFDVEQWINQR